MTTQSMYAYVRQPHKAWRDAEIEVVSIDFPNAFIDVIERKEINNTLILETKPLIIDGVTCTRVRTRCGKVAAIASCGNHRIPIPGQVGATNPES